MADCCFFLFGWGEVEEEEEEEVVVPVVLLVVVVVAVFISVLGPLAVGSAHSEEQWKTVDFWVRSSLLSSS